MDVTDDFPAIQPVNSSSFHHPSLTPFSSSRFCLPYSRQFALERRKSCNESPFLSFFILTLSLCAFFTFFHIRTSFTKNREKTGEKKGGREGIKLVKMSGQSIDDIECMILRINVPVAVQFYSIIHSKISLSKGLNKKSKLKFSGEPGLC